MELTWGTYLIKNKYAIVKCDSAMKNTNGEIIIIITKQNSHLDKGWSRRASLGAPG